MFMLAFQLGARSVTTCASPHSTVSLNADSPWPSGGQALARPVVRRHCEVAAGVGCGVDPRSTGSAALEVLCNLSYVGGSADTPSVFFLRV